MFGRKNKNSLREIIDSLAELRDTIEELTEKMEKFNDRIKSLENSKEELKELKQQVISKNNFVESLLIKLIDKPVEKKTNAVEEYIAKRNTDRLGNTQSVRERNGKPRLPG